MLHGMMQSARRRNENEHRESTFVPSSPSSQHPRYSAERVSRCGVQGEGRTLRHQHGDRSQGMGDDADHETREPHGPGRQKYRDKDEENKAKIEEHHKREAAAQSQRQAGAGSMTDQRSAVEPCRREGSRDARSEGSVKVLSAQSLPQQCSFTAPAPHQPHTQGLALWWLIILPG